MPESELKQAGPPKCRWRYSVKRFFNSAPDVLVQNSIRLEADGDAAQVDHLVIHSHGLSIVESKSVHGKVQIKDDGQWIRWFNGNQSKGMASPITQARLQEKFFRNVLGRASKNDELFAKLPIDLYVAISDSNAICGCMHGKPGTGQSCREQFRKGWESGALGRSKANREKSQPSWLQQTPLLLETAPIP